MDGKTVVAVVGCGRIASAAHFPALSRMEDVEIRYACDLIAEKAEDKRTKFGAERAITDYREALADPEVDVVYVLTPNYAHYTVTMDALAAGKHVFCEKPITVSYELALRMSNEAEKRNRLLAIGVCNRYHRSVEELRSLCESGRFGKIYTVYCSFRENRSIPGLGGAFTTAAESGGGVLIDWGIHFLDLILYVIGGAKILTASAETYSEMAKNIEDYKFSSMWAGPPVPGGTNDVEDYVTGFVRTDKCSISFNGAWAENIDTPDQMFIDFMGDKAGAHLRYGGRYRIFDSDLSTYDSEGDIPNMYAREDRDFIDSCREFADGSVRLTRGNIRYVLESQKLLSAVYESAKAGREISFPSVGPDAKEIN